MLISYLIIVLVIGLLLYAVIESGSRNKRRTSRRPSSRVSYNGYVNPTEIRTRWDVIMATSATGASGLKNAINEADKLFDYVLKQRGYPGEKMADRLKLANPHFVNRNNVWRAHKLRNALAHEVGFDLVVSQAKEALADFEQGLKDLGAL